MYTGLTFTPVHLAPASSSSFAVGLESVMQCPMKSCGFISQNALTYGDLHLLGPMSGLSDPAQCLAPRKVCRKSGLYSTTLWMGPSPVSHRCPLSNVPSCLGQCPSPEYPKGLTNGSSAGLQIGMPFKIRLQIQGFKLLAPPPTPGIKAQRSPSTRCPQLRPARPAAHPRHPRPGAPLPLP